MKDTQNKNMNQVANLALVLSVVALLAVAFTYTNLDERMTSMTQQRVEMTEDVVMNQTDRFIQNTEAIIERIDNGDVPEDIEQDIASLRSDISQFSREADEATQESLERVDDNLSQAEEALRTNTAQAIDSLQLALEELESFVQ